MITSIWLLVYDLNTYDPDIWLLVYDYKYMIDKWLQLFDLHVYDQTYDLSYMNVGIWLSVYDFHTYDDHIWFIIYDRHVYDCRYMMIRHMGTYMIMHVYDYVHMTRDIWLAMIWSYKCIIYGYTYMCRQVHIYGLVYDHIHVFVYDPIYEYAT